MYSLLVDDLMLVLTESNGVVPVTRDMARTHLDELLAAPIKTTSARHASVADRRKKNRELMVAFK